MANHVCEGDDQHPAHRRLLVLLLLDDRTQQADRVMVLHIGPALVLVVLQDLVSSGKNLPVVDAPVVLCLQTGERIVHRVVAVGLVAEPRGRAV